MDNLKKSEEGDVSEDFVFIESYCSSGEEEGILDVSDEKRPSTNSQTARPIRESSPPLLLAFPITRGQSLEGSSTRSDSSTGSPEEDDGEDFEQPVEEWMVLGGEEQEGDSSIQLNLGYWCSSESESDSGDGDLTVKSFKDIWAVSGKDKFGVDKPLNSRYFGPGRDALCTICGRAGHVAKSCYYHKKCPRCILCGIRGHIQKDCPSRPCSSCGLQSHGLKPCETPPVWNQLCRRCAVMGHMSDTCPDIWRQYHLTIRLELPLRPQGVHTLQHKRHLAHCYNCSKKGHYGFECTKRMMVSGTFPSLPYVCHYDTIEDILQRGIRTQKGTRELAGVDTVCPSNQQHLTEPYEEAGEENQSERGRCRMKQEMFPRTGRKKTWPERRRERQQVKKLRREAQARREGGILGRSRCDSDDEGCFQDLFRSRGHCQATPSPLKKKEKRADVEGRKSKKSREAERWRKRGGMRRGYLHPHCEVDIGGENLFSPKQRIRHRRR